MRINVFKIFLLTYILILFSFSLITPVFGETNVYTPLTPINGGVTDIDFSKPDSFSLYIENMYKLIVGVAGVLAVLMIMWGGIEYMSTDAIGGKEEAKGRINNALLGLMIALGSYLILQTINKDFLRTDLFVPVANTPELKKPIFDASKFAGGDLGGKITALDSVSSGSGGVTFTSYGYKGDLTPDTNSSEARGDRNNLLKNGSVALSPDLIRQLGPQPGAAVYVGDTKVGYYDDRTAESYNGKVLTGRVDIYDPSGSLGGNNFSKKTGGAVRIDNTDIRKQTPNPSKK